MSKTYIKTFLYNFGISTMGQKYNHLDDVIEKYLKEHPNVEIIQIEHLWGDRYGARMAVLFKELATPEEGTK